MEKHRLRIDSKSAQGEFPIAQSIVQDIVRREYDYLITLSTPALQVAASVNKKIPHVFGAVTDPYRMGIARNEIDHIPNITGLATFQPVETTIRVMRELFPGAKRIGLVWNPGEACSEACTYKARDAAKKYGFELVESNVASTSEVLDAVRALVKRGVDIFFTSGDNTVILALPSIVEVLKEHRIPYFTNDPSDVERGAFVSIGADYYEVGRETARHARLVIEGKEPREIPIKNFVPEAMWVHLGLGESYGARLSEDFLKRAQKVKSSMIELENVHKRFNAGTLNEVYALRGVSLHIQKGEFVTVIGTNGSGKSTLLNAVSGSFLPDSGAIRIGGEDMTRLRDFERSRHVARVFQDPYKGTAPDMSIAENLHMAFLRSSSHYPRIGLKGGRLAGYRERVRLLEMQLEDRLDDLIGTLSGGQRQALTLLMAVIGDPGVLLLDEHTAALDPKSARQVIELTKKFVEQGNLTTLMVTHSMQQALELGSRTIMMHRGEVIDDISSREKKHSTVEDLLDRFAELRKAEKLTTEMLEELRREYV